MGALACLFREENSLPLAPGIWLDDEDRLTPSLGTKFCPETHRVVRKQETQKGTKHDPNPVFDGTHKEGRSWKEAR